VFVIRQVAPLLHSSPQVSKRLLQDEIPIIFGTTTSPSTAQTNLTRDIQGRLAAFMRTGDPNVAGSPTWARTTNTDRIAVLPLGGAGPVDLGACELAFWGSTQAQFDWQIHGL
jgi:hypothetical protein